MAKKYDLPAMPFYIGDWKKDPGIQVLTKEQKMIWLELLMLMWESEERGYLTINKKPMSNEMISIALNLDNQNVSKTLTLFEQLGLYSKRENDNAIYSRKIIKIVELSNLRKKAGLKGGNPILVNLDLTKSQAKGLPNAENETETENINENINNIIDSDDMQKLWISTWGRNPKIPEIEETEKLIKKFGFEKVKGIYKEAALDGFNKLRTLIGSLDANGNIIPKNKNGEEPRTIELNT